MPVMSRGMLNVLLLTRSMFCRGFEDREDAAQDDLVTPLLITLIRPYDFMKGRMQRSNCL